MADYAATVAADTDLLAYWRLGESSGATSVADSGPSGYTGTPANVTFGATGLLGGGQSGTSATFNGTSSTIAGHANTASGVLDFDYNESFTLEFIVKPNVTRSGGDTQYPVVTKYAANDTTTGWECSLHWNNSTFASKTGVMLRLRVNGSNQLRYNSTNTDLANATTYHVIVSYDHTQSAANRCLIWVNGRRQAVTLTSAGTMSSISNSNPVVIGSRNGGQLWGKYDLQEVSIYDRVFVDWEDANRLVRAFDQQGWSAPVNLLIDTDCYTDSDDAGGLATLLNLSLRSEAVPLAVNVNTGNTDVPFAVSAILDYYGYSSVPIAQTASGELTSTTGCWADEVRAAFSYSLSSPANSLNTYRQALHDAADGSVTICSLGYLWDIQALMNSPSDGIDSRTGQALIAAKVVRLVVMGGDYVGGTPGGNENNFNRTAAAKTAANDVCANWPTSVPIYFFGYTAGLTIITGSIFVGQEATHPVAKAYDADGVLPTGNSSWDAMAALLAVRGQSHADRPYFALIRGTNSVNSSTGANTFTVSDSGPHYFAIRALADSDFVDLLHGLYDPVASAGPLPLVGGGLISRGLINGGLIA